MTMRCWMALLLPLAALAAACDSSGPETETRQPGDLTILRMAEDAPALETYDTTFTAIRGEDAELRIRFEPRPGESSGEEFLRFRLDDNSLVNDENGNPIPIGGEIDIRVRILNPSLLDVEFQPSGLRFNRLEPAELRLRYGDDDLDDDGDIDDDDRDIEQQLSLWRQEQPGDPWVRIGSVVLEDFDEVEGEIFGFTHYAIAF